MNRTKQQRIKLPPIWLGVHEAAHAVARLALGMGPYIEWVSVVQDGDTLGQAHMQPRVSYMIPQSTITQEMRDLGFLDDAIASVELDIVETFAGPIAEYRHKHGWLTAAFIERQITDRSRTMSDPTEKSDCGSIRRALDWLEMDDETAKTTLHRLWHQALLLVHTEYPGITRMGRALCQHGTMTGEDFNALWLQARPTEAQRARRAAKWGAPA